MIESKARIFLVIFLIGIYMWLTLLVTIAVYNR